MGKVLVWMGAIFTPIGLLFAGIGGWFFAADQELAGSGLRTPGRVIEVVGSRDSDGDTVYRPVVEFVGADGQRHIFTGSVGSNPPSHSVGEQVEVIYAPGNPGDALLDSFTERYLFPLVFGGMGALFATIGAGMLTAYFRRRKAIAELRARGLPIEAEFLETYRDTRVKVNGRSPYRVACQAVHPGTGQMQRFESDPVWIDPTGMIGEAKVRVLVDPQRPERHYVDLSRWVDESEGA
ncbi:MAG TPA: DUF3592 domain-containing protein [Alteraurantiacibacter sp.]|jgi:hypothetical protein